MLQITVLHVPRHLYGQTPSFDQKAQVAFAKENMLNYNMVAKLSAYDLEKAYELTNTINYPWYQNAEVDVFHEFIFYVGNDRKDTLPDDFGIRSTSIGDIFMLSNGSKYLVTSAGFELLS
tara:strand:- start:3048 stop:3407 length:360 start_codon:yes stop_codon:yes gene_type:complete